MTSEYVSHYMPVTKGGTYFEMKPHKAIRKYDTLYFTAEELREYAHELLVLTDNAHELLTDMAPPKPLPVITDIPEPQDKWELVSLDPKGAGHTYRLPVPGGWLYRTVTYRYPELHRDMESALADYDGAAVALCADYTHKCMKDGSEIIAQTTVFVPDSPPPTPYTDVDNNITWMPMPIDEGGGIGG